MEALVGSDAHDRQLVERAPHAGEGLAAVRRPDDQFAEHRIVVQRHLVAHVDAAVPPHARATGDAEVFDPPRARQEAVGGVLARDAALERPAARAEPAPVHPHRLPGRDPELLAHQIDAVDHFCHRMLHLDPGVHFEEIERPVGGEQKLAGARAAVGHCLSGRDSGGTHPLAQIGVDRDRRRLLDQLLVPPLDGALALAEVDRPPIVGQHLDLDVSRALDEFFEVDRGVAEGLERLAGRALERAGKLLGRPHHPHSLPSTARHRLDHYGIAHLARQAERGAEVVDGRARAGDDRHARKLHSPPRLGLVAHGPYGRGRGPDPDELCPLDRLREGSPLGEEAVAGVDGVGACLHRRRDQPLDVEIALRRGSWPDGHR